MLVFATAMIVSMPMAHARSIIHSYALVNDDATLQVRNKTIELFGIHIPRLSNACRRRTSRCDLPAVRALSFKIQGFVECAPIEFRRGRRLVVAQCSNDGDDLSAYLINQGWAVARPEAPFAYHTLERVARERGLGIWARRQRY